ncbi:MAG: hypothetical protein JSV45_04565 [Chromatiales bacterium]|nr:MAG: hypothetical protein JSV45_04565 [Chromatiales bacterium]
MDAQNAYQFGRAITDARQAARRLWKTMLPHGRSSAWFVLGYWRLESPSAKLVEQTFAAIQEQMAYMAYEGACQPADQAWVEWLLYAPVAEVRRELTSV